MVAVTAAEWLGLFVVLVGGSAGAAWLTGVAALRKVRIDAETQRSDTAIAAREVAVSEVQVAMTIYAASVTRLGDEVKELTRRVDQCEERHVEHAKICPLQEGGR